MDQPASKVLTEISDDGVMIVRLGAEDEKLVTLTAPRMASIREAVKTAKEEKVSGLVFAPANESMFAAGADINVIQDLTDPVVAEELAREGQETFQAIEDLPFPTVAAISGPCVGGGCELVLACRWRLISDHRSSQIGLPEVKLGILPGFGGTQRLPRLIGLPKALDIILAGKTLKSKPAKKAGLVHEIVPYDQLVSKAEKIALRQERTREISISLADKFLTFTAPGRYLVRRSAEAGIKKKTKGHYPAPPAALQSVLYGLKHGKEKGYPLEAKELGKLAVTPESKALVRLFFLSEDAKRVGKAAREEVKGLQTAVIGAGVMGAGIAGTLAKNGFGVILKDTKQEALDKGVEHIKKALSKSRSLSEADREKVLERITPSLEDPPSLKDVSVVIEAIVENLDVKKKVLSDIAGKVDEAAIITSNTSSLSLTEIGEALPKPELTAGMHFFNPVERMPLVEIIRGEKTADRTIVLIAAIAAQLGKFPVVVKDVPGFLVNRILSPYLNEAGFLLKDGYSVEDVDSAALQFGMPMGPVRLIDEVGLDVATHVAEVMIAGYGERMAGAGLADKLVDAGRLGKKSGGGFYDYEGKDESVSPKALTLLGLEKKREIGDRKTVIDRLMMSLINEAVLCLDEGVAGVPGEGAANQIDLATVMGMGFPPFRGGLIAYAEKLGAKEILQTLEHLKGQCGDRFTAVEGITKRAEGGKSFYEAL